MENLPNISFNSKLRNQTNGFIRGNVESFINTMDIGQSLTHHCDNLNDGFIRDDMESIVNSVKQGRMFSNSDYHRRFKMTEGKK